MILSEWKTSLFDVDLSEDRISLSQASTILYLSERDHEEEYANDLFHYYFEKKHLEKEDWFEFCLRYALSYGFEQFDKNRSLLSEDECLLIKGLCLALDGQFESSRILLDGLSRRPKGTQEMCAHLTSCIVNDAMGMHAFKAHNGQGSILDWIYTLWINLKNLPKTGRISEKVFEAANVLKIYDQRLIIKIMVSLAEGIHLKGKFEFNVPYELLSSVLPVSVIASYQCARTPGEAHEILRNGMNQFPDNELLKSFADRRYPQIFENLNMEVGTIKERLHSLYSQIKPALSEDKLQHIHAKKHIRVCKLSENKDFFCYYLSVSGVNIVILGGNLNNIVNYDYTSSVDAIFVTHIEGTSLTALESLCSNCSRVKIYASYPIASWIQILIKASSEQEVLALKGFSEKIESIRFLKWIQIQDGFRFRFHQAGNTIGNIAIELEMAGNSVLCITEPGLEDTAATHEIIIDRFPHSPDLLLYLDKGISESPYEEQWGELKRKIKNEIDEDAGLVLKVDPIGNAEEMVCLLNEMQEENLLHSNTELLLAGLSFVGSNLASEFLSPVYENAVSKFQMLSWERLPQKPFIILTGDENDGQGQEDRQICETLRWSGVTEKYVNEYEIGKVQGDKEWRLCPQNSYDNFQKVIDRVKPVSLVYELDPETSNSIKLDFEKSIFLYDMSSKQEAFINDMEQWLKGE